MTKWAEAAGVLRDYLDARGLTPGDVALDQPFSDEAVRFWLRQQGRPSKRNAKLIDDLLQAGGAIQTAYGYSVVSLPAEATLADRVQVLEDAMLDLAGFRSDLVEAQQVLLEHVQALQDDLRALRRDLGTDD